MSVLLWELGAVGFLFHFPVKTSVCSKDEQEHAKYSVESDRAKLECDTCSKAIEVIKAMISLAETCDEVLCWDSLDQ